MLVVSSQEVQLDTEPEQVLQVSLQATQVPLMSIEVEGHTQRPPGPVLLFPVSQDEQAMLCVQVLHEESQGKQEEPDKKNLSMQIHEVPSGFLLAAELQDKQFVEAPPLQVKHEAWQTPQSSTVAAVT